MTEGHGDVEQATRGQLRDLNISIESSALAASAIALAKLLDGDLPSREVAPVARELRGTMTDLTRQAAARPGQRSGLDELRAKREQRRSG